MMSLENLQLSGLNLVSAVGLTFSVGFLWGQSRQAAPDVQTRIVYMDKIEEFKLDTSMLTRVEMGRKITTRTTNKKADGETTITEVVDILLPVVSKEESTKKEKTTREIKEDVIRTEEHYQPAYFLGARFTPTTLDYGRLPFGAEFGFRLGSLPAFGTLGVQLPSGVVRPQDFSLTLGLQVYF